MYFLGDRVKPRFILQCDWSTKNQVFHWSDWKHHCESGEVGKVNTYEGKCRKRVPEREKLFFFLQAINVASRSYATVHWLFKVEIFILSWEFQENSEIWILRVFDLAEQSWGQDTYSRTRWYYKCCKSTSITLTNTAVTPTQNNFSGLQPYTCGLKMSLTVGLVMHFTFPAAATVDCLV